MMLRDIEILGGGTPRSLNSVCEREPLETQLAMGSAQLDSNKLNSISSFKLLLANVQSLG